MDALEFGKYLKSLREAKKMTIRQLELYSGVSNAYLSHIENGKRGIPSPEILRKLSKPLDVPYEELMARAGYIDAVMMDDEVVEGVQKGTIKSEDIIKKPVLVDGKIVLKHELKDRPLNLSEEKINEVLERFAKLPPEKQRIIEGMLELLMKEDNK